MKNIFNNKKGFSLVEVLLSVSILGFIMSILVGGFIYGQQTSALTGATARATFIAEEGIEVVRNIAEENFSNLIDGTHGLSVSENQWQFSNTSDTTDVFTRAITISSVNADKKQITSTVTWQQNAQRPGTISLVTYVTNWRAISVTETPTPTPITIFTPTPTSVPNTPTPTRTPTPTVAVNSCASYCRSLGSYTTGTCRANQTQCRNNNQTYQSGGDFFCTGGANADTCCCQ